MGWKFTGDGLFLCDGYSDDTPDPQAPQQDKTLCVRCDRAMWQVCRTGSP
ncbi:hypothetical protein [Streptomyces huasconensis]